MLTAMTMASQPSSLRPSLGHVGVTEVLLQARADPNARCLLQPGAPNSTGGAALHLAAFHGHGPFVNCLIEAGADVDIRRLGDSVTPL